MPNHSGVIHNGQLSDRLPFADCYYQFPLKGNAHTCFSGKTLPFDRRHFRLFSARDQVESVTNSICLTLAAPRFELPEAMTWELLGGIRFERSPDVQALLRKAVPRNSLILPAAIHVRSEDLARAATDVVCATLARVNTLPGRAMYKRIDTFLRLEKARDYLESHFLEDPNTDQLATEAAISRAHFIRLFGAFFGTSPKQRILELKMDRARELLEQTSMNIWEVAESAGFGNRCAFQRMFRQRLGITPGEYRTRHRYRHSTRSVYLRTGVSAPSM